MSRESAYEAVVKELEGFSHPSSGRLVKVIDNRVEHSRKCRKRNVNECKKCDVQYRAVRSSFDDAREAGAPVAFHTVLTASTHLVG